MGYYINENSKGEPLKALNKAAALVRDGATVIKGKIEFQENLVCVVENGFFDAAGYAHNESEMEAFLHDDGRPKTWLVYEHAKKLSGYLKYNEL